VVVYIFVLFEGVTVSQGLLRNGDGPASLSVGNGPSVSVI
jgi:hypothetical protein